MLYLQFKEGVQLTITQAVNKILTAGEFVFRTVVNKPCVVTSGSDGQHQEHSKHYTHEALDLRRFHLEAHEVCPIVEALKDTLGQDFDVVIEGDHFHIEFDPKGKKVK